MIEDMKRLMDMLAKEELRISNIHDVEEQAEELALYKLSKTDYVAKFKRVLDSSHMYLNDLVKTGRINKVHRNQGLAAKAIERAKARETKYKKNI